MELNEVVVDTQGKTPGATSSAKGPVDGYVPRVTATGTKTATPLIETPQSISVVGAEQIRDQNAQTLDEATRYSSGIHSETLGSDTRGDEFLIRGFPGQVSGYYLDGLQLLSNSFGTFAVEPWGLERIEVLKGPASVLYGGSNTGGIINAVSKRPPDAPHGTVLFGINNFGNVYGAFDVGGPVSKSPDNQWSYRVEGLAREGGTQVDFSRDDRLFIAPSLRWHPDAATSVTLLGSYQKDRTSSPNFLPYVGTVVNAPFGKIPTRLFTSDPAFDTFQRNQALIGYEAEHRFNDVFTVRQNLRYADLRVDARSLFGGGYVGDPSAATLGRFNFTADPHVTQFAVDNQLEARFHTGVLGHVALFGVDYKHYTLDDPENFSGGPSLNLFAPTYFTGVTPTTSPFLANHQVQDQVGLYLQDQIKYDHWTLVLSGRHDGLNTSLQDKITPSNNTQSADNAFTGRIGLIYTTDSGVAPYATYATSFDPQLGTNSATGKLEVPVTGQLTEVGVKYQPIGTNLTVGGALFNLVQQNVLTTDPNNPLNTIQTGEERSRGLELEAQASLTQGLKLLASYTALQVRTTRDLDPSLVGKIPLSTPQNFGALFLDYTMQDTALRGLGVGAGVRYVGSTFASQDNLTAVPSYAVADATVHYERDHWRAALNVTNLFDRTYVPACSSVSACFYGERRKATLSLAYSW